MARLHISLSCLSFSFRLSSFLFFVSFFPIDLRLSCVVIDTINTCNTLKIIIHSSCEIEYFVETHLCKLCVILRSRVLRVVSPH